MSATTFKASPEPLDNTGVGRSAASVSRRRRVLMTLAAFLLAVLVANIFDFALWRAARAPDVRVAYTNAIGQQVVERVGGVDRLRGSSLYQLFRQAGYLPTWIVLALGVTLAERVHASRTGGALGRTSVAGRMWSVVASAALAGIIAACVAGVVRRVRPGELGLVRWDWPIGSHAGEGLGFPSSHAAVAAGAAFMLGRVFPGSQWVAIPLAIGCGCTRLQAGAHFASDVVGGWMLGWASALLVGRAWRIDR